MFVVNSICAASLWSLWKLINMLCFQGRVVYEKNKDGGLYPEDEKEDGISSDCLGIGLKSEVMLINTEEESMLICRLEQRMKVCVL